MINVSAGGSAVVDEMVKKKKKSRAKKPADGVPAGPTGEVLNDEGGVVEKKKRQRKCRKKKTAQENQETGKEGDGGENENQGDNEKAAKPKNRKPRTKKPKSGEAVVSLAETPKDSVMCIEVSRASSSTSPSSVISKDGNAGNKIPGLKVAFDENLIGKMCSGDVPDLTSATTASSSKQASLPAGRYPIGISEMANKIIYVQTSKGKVPFKIPENAIMVPVKDAGQMGKTSDALSSQSGLGGMCAKIILPPSSIPISMLSTGASTTAKRVSGATAAKAESSESTSLTSLLAHATPVTSVSLSASVKSVTSGQNAPVTLLATMKSSSAELLNSNSGISIAPKQVESSNTSNTDEVLGSTPELLESNSILKEPDIAADRKKDNSFPISISTSTAGETIQPCQICQVGFHLAYQVQM
jgi:hypothetical protein